MESPRRRNAAMPRDSLPAQQLYRAPPGRGTVAASAAHETNQNAHTFHSTLDQLPGELSSQLFHCMEMIIFLISEL